jgi:hypothetical protein
MLGAVRLSGIFNGILNLGNRLLTTRPILPSISGKNPGAFYRRNSHYYAVHGFPSAGSSPETEQNVDKQLPQPFRWFRSMTLKRADFVIARNSEAVSVVRKKGSKGFGESRWKWG